jgi:uncharacterized membrane protein
VNTPEAVDWAHKFRLRQRIKGSLWFAPLLGGLIGVLLAEAAVLLESLAPLPDTWQYARDTARGILTAVVGAMVSLFGLVVAITVLVVQVATNALSPRFMRLWYRDRLQKLVLAAFVGTVTLALSLLRRLVSTPVPSLGVTVAAVAVGLSLILLLLYLDRFAHQLRPVGIGAWIARQGVTEADRVAEVANRYRAAPQREAVTGPPAAVVRTRRSGVVQAIQNRKLVALAVRHDCLLVLDCSVGDFLPVGSPVVSVHTTGPPPDPRVLAGLIAFGEERTIEGDPGFALRVMVDIAVRAISPSVNDPTTTVQLLDHIEVLLFKLAEGVDAEGRLVFHDLKGTARLVKPVRGFADYLRLAVTEIRQYGGGSAQVCRRLAALLEALRDAVGPDRRPVVEAELAKLDRTVTAHFTDPDDLAYARRGDRQGIGGPG